MAVITNPKSLAGQILLGVFEQVKALQFEEIASNLYRLQRQPFNEDRLDEGVFVTPARETIQNAENGVDDIGYGVQVTYIKKHGNEIDFDETADTTALHRERCLAEFLPTTGAPFAPVPDVVNVTAELGPVFDNASHKAGFDAWAIVFRFTVRLPRKSR